MQYMFLIYADPKQPDTPELLDRYRAFTECVAGRGALRGGNQLHRTDRARTVSMRAGKVLNTDGPCRRPRTTDRPGSDPSSN